eukprot:356283-Pelagomonas_calceolata.AAC.2
MTQRVAGGRQLTAKMGSLSQASSEHLPRITTAELDSYGQIIQATFSWELQTAEAMHCQKRQAPQFWGQMG